MDVLSRDLRFAGRSLRKAPGLATVAALSLGLGIGATTTVLCWMKNVVWRPLPGASHREQLAAAHPQKNTDSRPQSRRGGAPPGQRANLPPAGHRSSHGPQ